jgi:sugar phosphate isomerase/epimerase
MARIGFEGIEVRFTADGQLDPSEGPLRINRLRPDLVGRTRRALRDNGIELVLLSGYHGDFSTRESTSQHRSAISREIEAAAELGCPLLRVMGGAYASFWRGGRPHRDTEKHTAEVLHELGELAGSCGVGIVMETHAGTMIETAAAARRLLTLIDSPHVGLTYDQEQLDRCGGEEPEEAVEILDELIRHVHLTPYRFEQKGTPERGPRVVKALSRIGYSGWISDEYPRHVAAPAPPAETRMAEDLRILREWVAQPPPR